eukprot:Anaeramoba_flamelloidesa86799_24.p1 GENE.a86799_24~~a86799_24.p1  ORF type:complete len:139 (-),score=30.89 a86799_24:240-656(-)
MGNKQNTPQNLTQESGSFQQKKRKPETEHHLVLIYDQSNTLPNFLRLQINKENFEFYGFKSSVVSYSYSDLDYWGYEKNKLLMIIKGNKIIVQTENVYKIFEEIENNINRIFTHLHSNSHQTNTKINGALLNTPQKVN